MNLNGMISAARIAIVKHGPDILTAAGVIGLVVSGIMAVSQTPKAVDILRMHEESLDLDEELTVKDKVADCWKFYAPSVALAVLSIGSIVFARKIDAKRMAAWAAAYQMSENALVRLKESVKDELGEKKLKKIEDAAGNKFMEEHPIEPSNVLHTGNGEHLFCDYYSGRYFYSSVPAIKALSNQFISLMLRNGYASINEWESLLGFDTMTGFDLGFVVDQYNENKSCWEDPIDDYGPGYLGEPCGLVKFPCMPKVDYQYYA